MKDWPVINANLVHREKPTGSPHSALSYSKLTLYCGVRMRLYKKRVKIICVQVRVLTPHTLSNPSISGLAYWLEDLSRDS